MEVPAQRSPHWGACNHVLTWRCLHAQSCMHRGACKTCMRNGIRVEMLAQIGLHRLLLSVCMRVYICVHVCMMYMCMYMYMYMYMNMCIHTHTYIHIYIYMYIHTYIYIYTYVCMYTCIHKYIYYIYICAAHALLLCSIYMSLFGRNPTVEQKNVAPPSFGATATNASRTSHVLQLHPPLPPASMLRPSNTRRPRWCNIFCVEMPFLFSVPAYTNIESRGGQGEVVEKS